MSIVYNPNGGQFWYGKNGFLYKRNTAGGTRLSTLMGPGGTAACNRENTIIYNKYKPGTEGVGATSIATRRARNRRATVCTPENRTACSPCYMRLGLYSRYYNPNGYVPCP